MQGWKYYHVDVFSKGPFTGNGLTVLLLESFPQEGLMQKIAQEMKQFETIFLVREHGKKFAARIFTVEEELDFAGHPLLGAAAVLQKEFYPDEEAVELIFHLREKDVVVESALIERGREYRCCMNQGMAEMLGTIETSKYPELIEPLNLSLEDLAPGYPLEVISTGLPYLLVPVRQGLERTGIFTKDYESRLQSVGAKFVYILDMNRMEGRTWDNLGKVEDVATGSAAGPAGAYLYGHGVCSKEEEIVLHQGRFLERDSEILVCRDRETDVVLVSGTVTVLAVGELGV